MYYFILGKPGKASISSIVTAPNTARVFWNRVLHNGNYELQEVTYQLEYQLWEENALPNDGICSACLRNNLNSVIAEHTIVSLRTYTTYSIRIIATNKAGSSYSGWRVFKTKGELLNFFYVVLSD